MLSRICILIFYHGFGKHSIICKSKESVDGLSMLVLFCSTYLTEMFWPPGILITYVHINLSFPLVTEKTTRTTTENIVPVVTQKYPQLVTAIISSYTTLAGPVFNVTKSPQSLFCKI